MVVVLIGLGLGTEVLKTLYEELALESSRLFIYNKSEIIINATQMGHTIYIIESKYVYNIYAHIYNKIK